MADDTATGQSHREGTHTHRALTLRTGDLVDLSLTVEDVECPSDKGKQLGGSARLPGSTTEFHNGLRIITTSAPGTVAQAQAQTARLIGVPLEPTPEGQPTRYYVWSYCWGASPTTPRDAKIIAEYVDITVTGEAVDLTDVLNGHHHHELNARVEQLLGYARSICIAQNPDSPKQCLYQKVAVGMKNTKMQSLSLCN